MNKNILIAFALMTTTIFVIQSCSKDTTQTPKTLVCNNAVTYSYTADVKPIFDVHCASFACHSNLVSAAGISLESFANAKQSTETTNVICSMKHVCKPMPQSAPKLSDSLIQVVECWAASGFQN